MNNESTYILKYTNVFVVAEKAQSQYWSSVPPPPPSPLFQWVRLGLEARGPSAAVRIG